MFILFAERSAPGGKPSEINFLFVGGRGRVWQQTDENTEAQVEAKHPTNWALHCWEKTHKHTLLLQVFTPKESRNNTHGGNETPRTTGACQRCVKTTWGMKKKQGNGRWWDVLKLRVENQIIWLFRATSAPCERYTEKESWRRDCARRQNMGDYKTTMSLGV